MRAVRGVFYFEVISNLGSAVFALLFPAAFSRQLSADLSAVSAIEFVRWYAVVLLVLALVLWAALRQGSDLVLRPVVVAFLVGDALQIAVSVRFGAAVGAFGVAVHAAIWTSVFYALARLYYLARTRGVGERDRR